MNLLFGSLSAGRSLLTLKFVTFSKYYKVTSNKFILKVQMYNNDIWVPKHSHLFYSWGVHSSSSASRSWTSFDWMFWPSQRPLSISLDPGCRLSNFFIFNWQISCSMLSSHPYLGLPCDLLVTGFQLNIFLTVLVSSIPCYDETNLVFKL